MNAPRKRKLQIPGIVLMAVGSLFFLVVTISRSSRNAEFSAGLISQEEWAGKDAILGICLIVAASTFVAGAIAFLLSVRARKTERV